MSILLSIRHFLCRPRHRPQRALKDGFGKTVVSWDMPKSCRCPSLDSCQKLTLDPQGSWPCSAPSRWSCVPSRRYGAVSSDDPIQNIGAPLKEEIRGTGKVTCSTFNVQSSVKVTEERSKLNNQTCSRNPILGVFTMHMVATKRCSHEEKSNESARQVEFPVTMQSTQNYSDAIH